MMEETVKKAIKHHVSIGAHPGFPDLLGFGRRPILLSPTEVKAYVIYQISALNGFVHALGGTMNHVKPHGALYNMAANDYTLARAIAEGVYAVNPSLILVGLANSEFMQAGRDIGLQTAAEVFADRKYTDEGRLVSRSLEGSVIHDKYEAIEQVLNIVLEQKVKTVNGKEIKLKGDTVCVHGDNGSTVELVKELKRTFLKHDIQMKPLTSFPSTIQK